MQSIPEAARLTLLELIVGALLASGGHVTQAVLALTPRLGWQAYHWMLERGRFRLLGLISALCRIVRREIGVRRCFVVIDGSLDNAEGGRRWHLGVRPGVAVRFDHAAKANRPAFLLCQCFVTLSAVVPCRDRSVPPACAAVPAMPARSPWPRDCSAQSALSCLLLDAMRGSLIHTASAMRSSARRYRPVRAAPTAPARKARPALGRAP